MRATAARGTGRFKYGNEPRGRGLRTETPSAKTNHSRDGSGRRLKRSIRVEGWLLDMVTLVALECPSADGYVHNVHHRRLKGDAGHKYIFFVVPAAKIPPPRAASAPKTCPWACRAGWRAVSGSIVSRLAKLQQVEGLQDGIATPPRTPCRHDADKKSVRRNQFGDGRVIKFSHCRGAGNAALGGRATSLPRGEFQCRPGL